MTVGMRLKEERVRLGLSQTDFAGLVGARKGTQISWEKDASSPNAIALMTFAEAGADVLYILTGRRTNAGPDISISSIEDHLATIRRDLLDQRQFPTFEDIAASASMRTLEAIIEHEGDIGTPQQIAEAKSLYDIASTQNKLVAYRAADHAQMRSKRQQLRKTITSTVEAGELVPSATSINLMTRLALEYGVPLSPLLDLMYELLSDGTSQRPEA